MKSANLTIQNLKRNFTIASISLVVIIVVSVSLGSIYKQQQENFSILKNEAGIKTINN